MKTLYKKGGKERIWGVSATTVNAETDEQKEYFLSQGYKEDAKEALLEETAKPQPKTKAARKKPGPRAKIKVESIAKMEPVTDNGE